MRRSLDIASRTAAEWTADNPFLRPNELGYETDTDSFKIGPGYWNDITDYFTKGGGGGSEDTTTLGTLISSATGKTTPVNADLLALGDSAASGVVKKLTWANVKATLKTYFDTLYQAVLVSGTNIKTINGTSIMGSGDLTVSGGGSSAWGGITGTLSAQTDLQSALDAKVGKTGTDTVAGVKTFSSSPIVPTPTTNFQAATKKYVDDNVGGGGGSVPAQSTSFVNGTTHLVTTADDRKVFFLYGGATVQMPVSMSGYPDGFDITIVTHDVGGSLLLRAGNYYGAQLVVGTQIAGSYGSDTTLSTNQAGMLRFVYSTVLSAWLFRDGRGATWA